MIRTFFKNCEITEDGLKNTPPCSFMGAIPVAALMDRCTAEILFEVGKEEVVENLLEMAASI